jgi:hypothetical protein
MVDKPTIGQRLIALKDHSRLSLAQIAERGGYSGASSIQKLFRPSYNPPSLSRKTADKLSAALEGTGIPPIRPLEIKALAGEANEIEELIADLSHYTHLTSKFISTFYTEASADLLTDADGKPISAFRLLENKNGLHMPCPDYLQGKQLIAFFVGVDVLWPRYEVGELALYEHRRPPVVGDDIVIRFSADDVDNRNHVIGRLQRISATDLVIEQLNPRIDLRIDRASINSFHRLLTRMELLPNIKSVFDA